MNASGESLSQRAQRASAWSSADGIVRALVSFGITVILARLVSPEEFGVVAMIAVFTAIAGVLIDGGLNTALIQRHDVDQVEASTAFYFNVAMGVLMALLLGLLSPWIAHFFAQPQLEGITLIMAASLVVSAFGAVHSTILTKEMNFRPVLLIGLSSSLPSGVLAILLAWCGFGVWSLAWQVFAQTALNSMLLWLLHPWRPLRTFNWHSMRQLLNRGGPVMAARLIDATYTRMYSVLIGKLYSATDLGFYTRAQSTQQFPTSLLTGVLSRVALPAFVETAEEPARMAAALAKSSRLLMFVNLPAMLGVGLVASPLVEVLFGRRWLPSVPLLQILCLAATLWPLQVLNIGALVAQGHSGLLLQIEILKKSLGILLLVAACRWGLEAIAWSQVAMACIAFFINSYYSGRFLAFGGIAQLKAIWRTGLATLTMVIVVSAFNFYTELYPLQRLTTMVCVGASTYLLTCLLLGELSLTKVRERLSLWWPGRSADG